MFPTVKELVVEVLTEAGLVVGMGVQQYTEPQIKLAIQRMFDFLLRKSRWEHLTDWTLTTLDGSTGVVTTDLSSIKEFEDIYQIKRVDDGRAILRSVDGQHLVNTNLLANFWTPLHYTDPQYATKRIRVWPAQATGQILIQALRRPDKFIQNSDIVPFDRTVMALGAAWYLVQADGMNIANAEKLQGMFDVAYNDYNTLLGTRDIGIGKDIRDGTTFTVSQ